MNIEYYINMADVQPELLPRPTPKNKLPIIHVECELWSLITWV